ncbi:MAG TPA: cytochrome P450 [Terriglobia bacterium]|nr:cytochrome P450 [Terriglobia bacterium]
MSAAAELGMLTTSSAKGALPPGPKGHFLIGNVPMLSGDILATIERWARQYGDIFFWRAVGIPVCYLTHPDYIEDVLVTRNHNFIKGMGMRLNPRFFGQGLLTSEGELWRRQRRLMQPAFHRRQIGRYGRVMVECTQRMLAGWQPGELRDLHTELDHLTLEIVARVLFNLDLTNHLERLEATARAVHARTARGPALVYATRYLPTPVNLRYLWTVHRLEKVIYQIIRSRQASGQAGDDLLSMLLQARDEDGEPMSERHVRDQLMTLIGAGNDTTTLTLCYAWYLLAQHPEVEARLVAEIEEVLGNRPPDVEDLPRLTYTEKIIKETLRLYPPVWAFVREATEAFAIGGYRLPARTNVVLPPWVVHRDPRFFDQPDEFRPERWTGEFEDQLPKFAYFPFGGGQRTCIGASFAKMQTALMLATMAQSFRCRLARGFKLKLRPTITLQPAHGIAVAIEKR